MKKYITWIMFIIFILIIIIYNISLANDVKLNFENKRNGSKEDEILNEDEYSVDIYAETTEKIIGGFQFQLLYPENIELIDVISWDIGQADINTYSGKVVGYKDEKSQSKVGKVRLCTLIFKILEESEDGSYDVRIDFNNSYSKIKDINGGEIYLESDKENGNAGSGDNEDNAGENIGNGNNEDNTGGNAGSGDNEDNTGENAGNGKNENILKTDVGIGENSINKNDTSNKNTNNQIQKNDSINLIEGNGVYRDEKGENVIPKTGEGSSFIIINAILISVTVVLGLILIRYKVKSI